MYRWRETPDHPAAAADRCRRVLHPAQRVPRPHDAARPLASAFAALGDPVRLRL
jgi:hypothetical protein